jgi:hypothetical protein
MSYDNNEITNVRVNILSNLLTIPIGQNAISRKLNELIIYMYDNKNIQTHQLLSFITNYFFYRNFKVN